MSELLENRKTTLQKDLFKNYWHPTCEHCGKELFVSKDDIKIKLFDPYEKELERIVITFDDETHKKLSQHPEKYIATVSTDSKKDLYVFECPHCKQQCELTREYMNTVKCSFYGDNNIRFMLSQEESEAAKQFMEEHNHMDEFLKNNKLAFSSLGMQFSFNITPGGFGNCVSIKCNHCGKEKDITYTGNW